MTSHDHMVAPFSPQFMQDAQEVMGMLVKVQSEQGEMEPDDPQVLSTPCCISYTGTNYSCRNLANERFT